MNYLYFFVDIAAVFVPFIFSFHPKLQFYKHWRSACSAIFLTAIPFVAWDIVFTYWGVWGFNPRYITGVSFVNLPLEEILFFICIPYSCLFSYHCFSVLIQRDYLGSYQRGITTVLASVLLLFSVFFYDHLYTVTTTFFCAVALLWLGFVRKAGWLGRFYFAYLVMLIPFFIVNGILTGTGLEQPVVWYNNNENIGVRMLTIPVEDTFYGMLMILLNVFFYERLRRKK